MKPLHIGIGLLIFFLVAYIACTTDDLAGTGHEGEAIVTGTVHDSLGNGIKNVQVELLPSDFNPVKQLMRSAGKALSGHAKKVNTPKEGDNTWTFTDSEGNYTFKDAPEDTFTLSGIDLISTKVVYHPEIIIIKEDINIGIDTLKEPGSILVSIPDSLYTSDCYIYIPGTYYYTKVPAAGVVEVKAPSGIVDVIYFDNSGQVSDTTKEIVKDAVIPEGTKVDSSKSITIPHVYSGYKTIPVGQTGAFYADSSECNNGDPVEYRFDWVDGNYSQWIRKSPFVYDSIIESTGDTVIVIYDSVVGDIHSWSDSGVYLIRAQARSQNDTLLISSWSSPYSLVVTNGTTITDTITDPSFTWGDSIVMAGSCGEYITDGAYCSNPNDTVEYRFDWGDTTFSSWMSESPIYDTQAVIDTHSWDSPGVYAVRAQARCKKHPTVISNWTDPFHVTVLDPFNDTSYITIPEIIQGVKELYIGDSALFIATNSYCKNFKSVEYRFDWGNYTYSHWACHDTSFLPDTAYIYNTWNTPGVYGIRAQARSVIDSTIVSGWSGRFYVNVIQDTDTLKTPFTPYGPDTVHTGIPAFYQSGGLNTWPDVTTELSFDWGDGIISPWSTDTTAEHLWFDPGVYAVRARGRLIANPSVVSAWSEPRYVLVYNEITPYITVPSVLWAKDSVQVNWETYAYTGDAYCSISDSIEYRFDWGDSTYSQWLYYSDSVGDTHTYIHEGMYEIRSQARCMVNTSLISQWSDPFFIYVYDTINNQVTTPTILGGDDSLPIDYEAYYYTGGSVSLNGDPVEYRFDWGTGLYSPWLIPDTNVAGFTFSWSDPGAYPLRSQARSRVNAALVSKWTPPLMVTVFDSLLVNSPLGPWGPDSLLVRDTASFMTGCWAPDTVEFRFNWGDSTVSSWSYDTVQTHAWQHTGLFAVRAQARKIFDTSMVSAWSFPLIVDIIDTVNDTVTVTKPGIIGPVLMPVNHASFFRPYGSICSNGDPVEYRFTWCDSTFSLWRMISDTSIPEAHSWSSIGSYAVRAQARSIFNNNYISAWSSPVQIPVETSVIDTVIPVLTIKGPNPINLIIGANYTEYGVTGWDNVEGDITHLIDIQGTVNTSVAGTYTVRYSLSDFNGNKVHVQRTVVVGKRRINLSKK